MLGQDKARSDFVDVKQTLMEVVERIDYHFNEGDSITGVPVVWVRWIRSQADFKMLT